MTDEHAAADFDRQDAEAAREDSLDVDRAADDWLRTVGAFREEELGGVLGADGNVYSDADPGL
jgi:hypothetical protein